MEWDASQKLAFEAAREQILAVARNRPGTHVAKCIRAYEEQQDLPSMIGLLEEVSKNTDYSTDLRISVYCCLDHFLRLYFGDRNVSRRSGLGNAGSLLVYSGRIYGDRVEHLYQSVEHQAEGMYSSEPQKEPAGEGNGPENAAPKPEEPRKRRAKKLTKRDVDPYLLIIEPRSFKNMTDEKRFTSSGFQKCTVYRTIEYLFLDHMAPNLWRHSQIVGPENPEEKDEKKHYKMFTYHVEHRYNTLLPDIPFERLNLIKEYVHTNQVTTSEVLNLHMTSKEYLDECISLENQMLASRYGATVRTRRKMDDQQKRSLDESNESSETAKRSRLEEDQAMEPEEAGLTEAMEVDQSTLDDNVQSATGEVLQNQLSIDSGLGFSQEVDCSLGVSQGEESSLSLSQMATSAIGISQGENSIQVDNSFLSVSQEENCSLSVSQVEKPPLSSTLAMNDSSTLAINDSSVLESTRLDLTEDELMQIDVGIGMDDVSDSHHTGQSFDDEGVVLSDCEDQKRLQSATADKDKDAVIKDPSEIKEESPEETAPIIVMHAVEPVDVPREVCYPLELNIFRFPARHVRRKCIFKLPNEFTIFMKSRGPPKRGAETKAPATPKPPTLPVGRTAKTLIRTTDNESGSKEKESSRSSLELIEFDCENNFRGFRRSTMDSGLEVDELQRANSSLYGADCSEGDSAGSLVNANAPNEAVNPEALTETASAEAKTEDDSFGNPVDENAPNEAVEPEVIRGTASGEATEELNVTIEEANAADATRLESELEATIYTGMDSELGATIGSELNVTDATNDGTQLDQATLEIPSLLDKLSIIDEAGARDTPAANVAPANEVEDAVDQDSYDPMIRDWHNRLGPTLDAAHARQNFNIKDLGTEILNVCKAGDNGRATLADVMVDKDPSIMCRYMLASLVLTNHGNVSLHFGKRDKSRPIEMSEFGLQLLSTKRMEIHPEDDVGNMSAAAAKSKPAAKVTAKRKSTEMASPEVFAKTVRLIQPIPKISQSANETDSGISSMCSSVASAPQGN